MSTLHSVFSDNAEARRHTLCMKKPIKDDERDAYALGCGLRIRRARELKGWSQDELSKATGYDEDRSPKKGLSPSRIGNFEQGTRRLGYEEAETLARALPPHASGYFLGVLSEQEASIVMIMRKDVAPA